MNGALYNCVVIIAKMLLEEQCAIYIAFKIVSCSIGALPFLNDVPRTL